MKNFLNNFKNKAILWQGLALLASLAILSVGLMFILNEKIVVTSPNSQNGAVLPDAKFYIDINGKTTLEELRKRITLTPAVAYDLTEEGGRYILQPFHPLEAGTKLDISVMSANSAEPKLFAFTVQNVLQLSSFFPADNGKKVNTATGIELEFNANNISLESIEKSVSIEPAVKGEFTFGDGRFVFYPLEPLMANTKYTVTVAQPLESETGAQLISSVQFSFVTESAEEAWGQSVFQLGGENISMNTLSTEAPIVQIYIDEEVLPSDQEISVDIYAFEGFEDYRNSLSENLMQTRYKYNSAASIDTANLSFRSAFQTVPVPIATDGDSDGRNQYRYKGRKLVLFPEALEEGWYAVELTVELGENKASQIMFLQVSDISVFYMLSGNNMLAWVNDAKSGDAIVGAEVEFTGLYRASGTTLADGTATITNGVYTEESGNMADGSIVTVTVDERTFVDGNYLYNYDHRNAEANEYMSYLFTDRPIYHTTDTIRIWGTVRPRRAETTSLTKVTLALGDNEVEAAVAPDGTFTAQLNIENMAMNYWTGLELKTGDSTLKSEYLRIEDYVKPVYVASTSTDKIIYAAYDDEEAKVTMNVSTFDGTPASSFGLEAGIYNSYIGRTLSFSKTNFITDANGEASFTASFPDNSDNSWRPYGYSYSFGNYEAESENFNVSNTIYAVHRNVMIDTNIKQNANDIEIELSTNKVTLARIKTSDDLWKKDALKGVPIARELTAELHKVYYEKYSTGKYYDFINRVTEEAYSYNRKDDIIKTLDIKTAADGTGVIKGLPKSDRESFYYVIIKTEDQNANTVETRAYLGADYGRGYNVDGNDHYVLSKQLATADIDLNKQDFDSSDGRMSELIREFKDNESVSFALEKNDEPITKFKGHILYTVVQGDYASTAVTDSAQFTLPFNERYVPNYIITGAYFDGEHIYALEDRYMYFNPEARELEVTLTTDKKSYSPADTMEVTATVKNKATGQLAADTAVVLSVVDEAVFALEEQSIDILSSLYTGVYYPTIQKYTSYVQQQYGGGGEKGGGGGDDSMRADFKDTAFFAAQRTNANGTVTFNAKLPDNITDWRLSTLAVTPNGRAGSTRANVKATKDYFVMPIVPSAALVGDTVTIGLRSAGTSVKDTDEVKYSVTVNGDGIRKAEEIHSTVKGYDFVSFEGLTEGEYTVTIAGECKDKKDAIRLPFSVIESGLEVSLVKTVELKNGIDIKPLYYPVNIAVYDKNYKFYSRVLSNIHKGGARTDMRMAGRYAAQLFSEQNVIWHDETALRDDLADVTQRSGTFSLFPYSSPDIEFTVRALLAMPELLKKGELEQITTSDAEWLTGAKSAYYLANALAGKALPQGLQKMAETDPTLTYIDRMYIATALAVAGDKAGAEACYNTFVKAKLSERTAVSGEKAYFIKLQGEKASLTDCTAAASMLATVLHKPEAEGLVRYLIENPSQYETYLLEQMMYLTNFAMPNSSGAKISYSKDGKEITKELNGITYISLTKKQLEEANFKVLAGDVYADIFYIGTPKQTANDTKKLIGVTKKLEPIGGEFKVGALVKVTITPSFDGLDKTMGENSIVIDDYIPTGMRYEGYAGRTGETGNHWYIRSRQGQRVKFNSWDFNNTVSSSIVYYVRCAAQGNYIVESSYVNSAYDSTWGASKRSEVKIS